MEETPNLDKWDDFAGEYLKADIIATFPVTLVPVKAEATFDDDRARLIVDVLYNEKTWKLELNKTNQSFLRNNGVKAPKDIVGKKLVFDKIKVRNPQSNTMVDSLIITKVEA